VAVHQVRAASAGSGPSISHSGTLAPRALEADELTILTGWAQALAEALAYAPERVEPLLADAHEGASWRSAFGIAEPSRQLGEAICVVSRAVEAAFPPGSEPTLEALLISCREDRAGEYGHDTLVRRVLRSTLEQVRTRQATEAR
jgi:hypothetical protein